MVVMPHELAYISYVISPVEAVVMTLIASHAPVTNAGIVTSWLLITTA
jgi:hypothetical protein